MKRLVTIQDVSCFGRCSSTVALPIISALGIETVILPTAVLSTHTGKFKNYTFHSLKNETKKITEHWKEEKIEFDAIYIGYIGSLEHIDEICDFIDDFSTEKTIVYVDPAMADNALIYSGLSEEYIYSIQKLCKKADIISPNIYEAMLLTGEKCTHDYTLKDTERIIRKLSEFSPNAIITGIHEKDKIYTLGYEKTTNGLSSVENRKIDGMFYGTGDIFSSVFIGTYLNNLSFSKAISFADAFIQKCINETYHERDKYWYGICFEKCLNDLTEFYINKNNK